MGKLSHPTCHIYVVLREIPQNPFEHRLGKFGRTNRTLRKQMGIEEEPQEKPKKSGRRVQQRGNHFLLAYFS